MTKREQHVRALRDAIAVTSRVLLALHVEGARLPQPPLAYDALYSLDGAWRRLDALLWEMEANDGK